MIITPPAPPIEQILFINLLPAPALVIIIIFAMIFVTVGTGAFAAYLVRSRDKRRGSGCFKCKYRRGKKRKRRGVSSDKGEKAKKKLRAEKDETVRTPSTPLVLK